MYNTKLDKIAEKFERKREKLNLAPLEEWDRVPWSAAQGLVEAARDLAAVQEEREAESTEVKTRLSTLQQTWRDIEVLQADLRKCVLDTEEQIKALQLERVAAEHDREEAQEAEMREQAAELERRTAQLLTTRYCIEDETLRLAPYQEFLERVASSNPVIYPAGGSSVLLHYERLCEARRELEERQSTALEQLQNLRTQAETFTSSALAGLDAQQARLTELRTRLARETEERDKWSAKVRSLRAASEEGDAEESRARASLTALYEQLWRRYHTQHATPPPRDLQGQADYVQLVMTALSRLVESRQAEESPRSHSLLPLRYD